MKLKTMLFILITFVYSLNVFSADCSVERLRVHYALKENNIQYYWIGNLEKQFIVFLTGADLTSELARKLKASEADSSLFYAMNFTEKACKNLNYNDAQINISDIKTVTPSTLKKVDCINCVNTRYAPIAIILPSIQDLKKILDKTAGFSPEKIDLTANMIAHLFERMNRNKSNANGAVFMVSLLRALDLLGLKNINRDQLQYLTTSFKDRLDANQFRLLQKMFSQIDGLAFTKDTSGNLVVSLKSVGAKTISIYGKDIPAGDKQTQDMMNKYFTKIEIENDTSMVFHDSKVSTTPIKDKRNAGMSSFEINSISKPSTVSISGIKVQGDFPFIGGVSIQPQELKVDIDDNTPVKANVGFKKGFIGMSYTFDLNN